MIDWGKTAVSVLIGAGDEFALAQDECTGKVGTLEKVSSLYRGIGLAGGLAGQAGLLGPMGTRWGDVLNYGFTPLFTKAMTAKTIREQFFAGRPARSRDYVPRRQPSAPMPPRAQRYPAPSYQNEFRNIRLS
jgi:hypothetical protein